MNCSLSLDDLIPFEMCSQESVASTSRQKIPRLVIGHNVSFDRSFIREQYFVQVKASSVAVTLSICYCCQLLFVLCC